MPQAAIGVLALLMAFSMQAQAQARHPTDARQAEEQSTSVNGQQQSVEMHKVSASGKGEFVGTIRIENRLGGTLFDPNLEGLPAGLHGFHIHENPDCTTASKESEEGLGGEPVAAGNAGGHLESGLMTDHAGPYGKGHIGDLPNLYVDEDGTARHPVFTPRVKLMDVKGHALVVHAKADNYSDEPENGGSGPRIACGVVR